MYFHIPFEKLTMQASYRQAFAKKLKH